MSEAGAAKDLICLVADKDMEEVIGALLRRPESLDIRALSFDIFPHPEKDPGCCHHGVDFLRAFTSRYRYALLLFDFEGCGRENVSSSELEQGIEKDLFRNGWEDRARVVVIEPELEVWVWSDSPEVDAVLGWSGRLPGLRAWLEQESWLGPEAAKPDRPKEAMEAALREARKPRSSATFRKLAQTVSFQRCQNRKFLRLKRILRRWFGPRRARDRIPSNPGLQSP